jgi:hypothetical protein
MSSSRLRLTAIVLSFPFAIGVAGCSSDPATSGSVTAASCSEANFVNDIPGALAYPCEVAP